MTNEVEIKISNEMRADQMKVLEIYMELAKEDKSLRKFLEVMNRKISRFLCDLESLREGAAKNPKLVAELKKIEEENK